jgi:hypothetical protein
MDVLDHLEQPDRDGEQDPEDEGDDEEQELAGGDAEHGAGHPVLQSP